MQQKQARIFTNDRCTGCNRCISACTVPEANFAVMENGSNKIYIDGSKCINCAKCIEVCPHDARDYLDDTEDFLWALAVGRSISLVAAPSIRSNFPEYKRLLGTLRKMGVKRIYDTSFGADITTWGYLRHMQKSGDEGLISQPCPAVVNYIEKHDPELISMLAPVQSPAVCTAIYMKKYRQADGEIAFLSPCIAKKDEFDDPNTHGLFRYNVTFRKLQEAFKAREIDYRKGNADVFDNARHGMGSLYPMPGGLKMTVQRVIPDAWVYQVEGQPDVRNFLSHYAKAGRSARPFLVDILNCAKGCNIGTGAVNSHNDDLSVSKVMYDARMASAPHKGVFRKEIPVGCSLEDFDRELRLEDFARSYTPKPVQPIHVYPQQVAQAYQKLFKDTEESRHVDCSSCGFDSCEEMAVAIAKGLNHVENCVEYHKSVLEQRQMEIEAMLSQQEQTGRDLQHNVQTIFASLSATSRQTADTVDQVSQINADVSALQSEAGRLNEMVDTLSVQMNQYVKLSSSIVSISTQTKLLSLNALVEAAHARELGKGFAVVAEEMKSLADQSANSAREIIESNDRILPMLEEVRAFSEMLHERTNNIFTSTQGIVESVRKIGETEQEITEAASRIVEQGPEAEQKTLASGSGKTALL